MIPTQNYLARHLPLTPTPNGFALLCLAGIAAWCWRRAIRVRAVMRELDVLDGIAGQPPDEWWFGTSPFDTDREQS